MSPAFKVGDHVRVPMGRARVLGIITEDRGPIGVHGRRLYQVEIPSDPFEPTTFELPEDAMEPVDPAEPAPSLDEKQVEKYLAQGGLIAILQSNQSGGRSQPRVWLTLDSLGNVTHTFTEERGIAGGAAVPFWAFSGEKIFLPELDKVRAYLKTFGLNDEAVERVVNAVGSGR